MKLRTILLLLTVAMAMALLVGGGGGAAMAADQPKGTSTTSNSTTSSAPSDSSESSSSLSAQASRIATKTFSNSSPILIPGDLRARTGRAAPYPSEIEVSGFRKGSGITNVKVNLHGLSHQVPDDIDMLLVGPKGQNIVLMSDVGGTNPAQNITLSLADEFETADSGMPDDQGLADPNGFGNYVPTNVGSDDTFPAPAPAPSTANQLSVFKGTNPNGTWKLFALDDEALELEAGTRPDVGELTGGWSLEITAKRRHH